MNPVMRKTNPAMMNQLHAALLLAASAAAVLALPGCGGSHPGNPNPVPTPTSTPTPAPTPTPTPPQTAACTLSAPTVDCSTVSRQPQMNADVLQRAVNAAKLTPDAMYPSGDRIYDLPVFRSKVIDVLTNAGYCGAWDYGNPAADEIFVRTGDGCVAEAYDLITGEGGVRDANKKSWQWQEGFDVPVPGPKPNFPRVGDTQCSLPGDRSTFCFSIKRTPGAFGPQVYQLLVQVMNENPALFDKNDFAPGQGEFVPAELRPAAWRILNVDGYIAALEAKIRANGFCGYVAGGDILKVKSLSMGNIFHEEMDVVQNPESGGDFVSFVVKDRCHDAGF
jgi:hypothetical protein